MGPISVWIEKTNIGSSQAVSTQTTASVNLKEDVAADTSTSKATKDRPSHVFDASEETHAAFTQELKKDSPVYESASALEDVFIPQKARKLASLTLGV